jgi:hypothetical protein
MTDELWISTITGVISNSSSLVDDVPLSFVHREGLGQIAANGAEESQNLRLLRLSVQGLEAWTLTIEQYEENVSEVLDLAYEGWKVAQSLKGDDSLKEQVSECFLHLYDACEMMLDHPHEGLEEVAAAYREMERLQRIVRNDLAELENEPQATEPQATAA